MELQHSSHAHPLILSDQKEGEDVLLCCGCNQTVSGPNYSCTSCTYHLHQRCAELPQKIYSLFHTNHPLFLSSSEMGTHGDGVTCRLCDKSCEGFVYSCSKCGFRVDISCAFPSCLYGGNQKHQFFPLLSSSASRSEGFDYCNACGGMGSTFEFPYVCTFCQLMVHRDCLNLAPTLNILQHPHPIFHTYAVAVDPENPYRNCDICGEKIKKYTGAYHCPEPSCDFDVHVRCALQFVTHLSGLNLKPFPDVHEGKLEVEKLESKIKHFSHEHELSLVNKSSDGDEDHWNCDFCKLPILSPPFYSCKECHFLLDKGCAKLSKRIKYRGHEHPFTLQAPTIDDEVFVCLICRHYYHGYFYRCEQCDITVDAGCMKIVVDGSIQHQSHDHLLFVAKYESHVSGVGLFVGCKACGHRKNPSVMDEYLRCGSCQFDLHFSCARQPRKITNDRYDKHPLFLTYHPLDDGCDEYYCRICENTRNNDLWFYYCKECDLDAHGGCLRGQCPYLRLGGTYTLDDVHPHSLTLKEWELINWPGPPCHECHQPCYGPVYECTDPECDFIIHAFKRCSHMSQYIYGK
ncbi:hypothetical protein Tsubulata_042521 [Turnera subulata]|uniref:Phorbol-ester/DAG-type domain-containing protein n=1 Tax=Turnera subulata TaxID=218843 RepID=A0A9Q0FZN4_9ROSI|nr:hypothetical protein Tsubulata_042521 [Turnera subulata]